MRGSLCGVDALVDVFAFVRGHSMLLRKEVCHLSFTTESKASEQDCYSPLNHLQLFCHDSGVPFLDLGH